MWPWSEDFEGSPVTETFSGAIVQEVLDFGEPMPGDPGQVRALREELPDQAVSVFVSAALPRTVGVRKVDLIR